MVGTCSALSLATNTTDPVWLIGLAASIKGVTPSLFALFESALFSNSARTIL